MIPERLIDQFTVLAKQGKRHTIKTYIGCVLLRILLGLLIYFKVSIFKNYYFIMSLFIAILSIFSSKLFLTKNNTWKVYIRTILIYITNIIINSLDNYKYKIYNKQSKNTSGLLVILDALMGLQSFHIQNNLSS